MSEAQFRQALDALERFGLLLTSDQTLPSVASLIAGEPIRGSWWAHPAANDIYDVADLLGDHPDVIIAKLVSGKNTYVHRRLWPAVHAIGRAREPWQIDALSPMGQRLLDSVIRQGTLRTNAVPWTGGPEEGLAGRGGATARASPARLQRRGAHRDRRPRQATRDVGPLGQARRPRPAKDDTGASQDEAGGRAGRPERAVPGQRAVAVAVRAGPQTMTLTTDLVPHLDTRPLRRSGFSLTPTLTPDWPTYEG